MYIFIAILNKEDLKKLDKSFDPSSTVNFDLRLMFDTDGKITDSFIDMLGGVGEMIANLTETKYKDGKVVTCITKVTCSITNN